MTIMPDAEPEPGVSPTAHLLDEIALYSYRPFSDEADPRPLPEERIAAGAVADMFDALIATMIDTRLEPDLEDLCWSLANLFHRAEGRIQRVLDDNEDAQKRSQQEALHKPSQHHGTVKQSRMMSFELHLAAAFAWAMAALLKPGQ